MTLLEKIAASTNKAKFTLYREGIFYKCYNEDAMVFSERVKSYKISVRYVKSVDAEVLSIGFPVSESEKGMLSLNEIGKLLGGSEFEEINNSIVFCLKDNLKEDYILWSISIIEKEKAKLKDIISSKEKPDFTDLVLLIKNYDLANSTPMQGMNFIHHLKTEIQTLELSYGKL